jgi:hypothetical protein
VQQQAAFLCLWVMAIILVGMLPLAFLMRKPRAGASPQGH